MAISETARKIRTEISRPNSLLYPAPVFSNPSEFESKSRWVKFRDFFFIIVRKFYLQIFARRVPVNNGKKYDGIDG
jgi:hypothetical protein